MFWQTSQASWQLTAPTPMPPSIALAKSRHVGARSWQWLHPGE